ncbi:MAG: hypothetical protein KGZ25_00015 [Planctomycetes bacterium]|nr:hypothetical protein [Planctomycetota bacterium]
MMQAGAASAVINNDIGTDIQGASVAQKVREIRDDLEANAVLLSSEDESVLLVSCDVAAIEPEYVERFRNLMGDAARIDSRNVLIAGTHTHAGPSVIPTCYGKPLDEDYLDRLGGWLGSLAREAAGSVRPAQISLGIGEARIGYNRRVCYADGTHRMHKEGGRDDCDAALRTFLPVWP